MNKTTIKKAAAVILAAIMFFGAAGMEQTVTAKQNVCSVNDEENEAADNDNMLKELLESGYLYFGSYPQREMDEEELTKEIREAEYVSGEAVVLGSRYLRVKEGRKYHYYKYEPICWKVEVIRDGIAFLESDKILDIQAYAHNWSSSGSSWKNINICKWLNSDGTEEKGFYHTAFSAQEQSMVIDNPILSDPEEVQTKVYLPKWGGKKETTDYTKYRERNQGDINCDGDWWLLDEYWHLGTKYVDSDGVEHDKRFGMLLDYEGPRLYHCAVPSTIKGVCPAITLDLTNAKLWYTEEEQEQLGNETEKEIIYKLETMYNQKNYPDVYGGFDTKKVDSEMVIITIKMTDISAKQQAEFLQKAGIEKQVGKKYEVSFAECQYSLKEKEQILPGDVDNNKKIDLLDAKQVLRWVLNLEQPNELYEKGDVDGNKEVTLADAKKILRMALKLL